LGTFHLSPPPPYLPFSRHNSFWNFSFQGSAAVQALLEKSDLTLDDLLEEDGLLTELKTLNQKLFDLYLSPPPNSSLIIE